ncbi:MAG: Rrf2 family transcriptional regulator [Bryobacteraceae bacterium]|nr:Rrf2 family transcriptional regulator [Bryobacteraceae bacterium]MDW8378053.1 Rrf2 family transcriptional regulator [Bryobacterales bacterium]
MLKLTKRADYGLIALKHLATQERRANGSGEVGATTKEIAELYRIPVPHLAKVLQKLVREGFLRSAQGSNGGYRLAKEASQINALEVIRVFDGPVILTSCFTDHGGSCEQSERCNVREPLRKIHEGILGLLASITIADMASDDPLAHQPLVKLYAKPGAASEVHQGDSEQAIQRVHDDAVSGPLGRNLTGQRREELREC